MRLTLRTLLAWIDGVLAGEQRDEIGAKVEGSPVAPKLIARIRNVVARPGLPAPRVDGRGLAEDPNTTAEFLDNVLAPDRLEAFERICIDSDIHLAEAADCHALLAELARTPDAIEPLDRKLRRRLRERLAEFVTQPPKDKPHEEAAALVQAVREAMDHHDGRRIAGEPAIQAAPNTTKKAAPAAWLSAITAVVLLVALGTLLGWSLLGPGKRGREVAAAKAAREPSPAAAQPVAEAAPVEPPPAIVTEPPVAPAAVAEPSPPIIRLAEPPPPDSPEAAAPPAPASPPAAAAAAAAINAAIPPPMQRADDDPFPAADTDPQPAVARPALPPVAPPPGMVAEGGMVLRRVAEGDAARWQAVSAGGPLMAVEALVVPVHSYPRLVRGDVSIRLLPGTQATLTTDADGTPRLEVVFGAAVIWTEAAEATVGITAAGLAGVATLGPRQMVGVAAELVREHGTDPAVTSPGRRARLETTGGIRWRQTELDGGPVGRPLAGLALDQPLPPRGGIGWTSAAPETATLLPLEDATGWMNRTAPADRIDRGAAAALAAALAAERPVEESLRELAGDRRVENRMAAAATLALLGDYEPLVTVLGDDRPGEKLSDGQWRGLHAATVPLALARGANAAARLRQAFADRGPAGRGEELYRLARGLAPAELAAGNAAALVELLVDDELIVRRSALLELERLVPDEPADRLDYRPDRSPQLNERGVEWWRRKVEAAMAGPPAPAP